VSAGLDAVNADLTIIPLTDAEVVGQATISPDGKYFVYTEYDTASSRMWLQTVGETSRVEVVGPQSDQILNLSFTPDSTVIYFTGWHADSGVYSLYRVDALGGVPAKIVTDLSGPVSFSPNGDQIVFVREDLKSHQTHIIAAASDGTQQRVIFTRTGSDIIRPNVSWSPDGKRVAFGLQSPEKTVTSCSIVAMDLATGAVHPLSNEKWDSCNRTVWTPDGSGIVFIGTRYGESLTNRRDQVYRLDIASGDARRLTSAGGLHEPMSLGITSANQILAIPYQRVSQIWSLDVGGNVQTAHQITSGQTDGMGGIEALPGGKIAFLSRAGDGFGISVSNADGPEERRQIVSDATMEEMRAARDGTFLIFAAKIGGYDHIFRANTDGSERRQITFGESVEIDSDVSPDGKSIVYASSKADGGDYRYSLEKISSDGGTPITLLSEACITPRFSHDGKTISCILGNTIRLISAENGATLKVLKTVEMAVLNTGALFAPDDKSLVYRVLQKNGCNLWQQRIAGGELRQLTDFSGVEIYNFAFARDGSCIYMARGNLIRNAILIKNVNH
ncbi:MAG: hypothetical protein ABJA02_00225, partial [Acidobacteriota bacterium]